MGGQWGTEQDEQESDDGGAEEEGQSEREKGSLYKAIAIFY